MHMIFFIYQQSICSMPKSESSFKGLIKWLIICCTLRQALSYIIMFFDVFTDDFKIDQYKSIHTCISEMLTSQLLSISVNQLQIMNMQVFIRFKILNISELLYVFSDDSFPTPATIPYATLHSPREKRCDLPHSESLSITSGSMVGIYDRKSSPYYCTSPPDYRPRYQSVALPSADEEQDFTVLML